MKTVVNRRRRKPILPPSALTTTCTPTPSGEVVPLAADMKVKADLHDIFQ